MTKRLVSYENENGGRKMKIFGRELTTKELTLIGIMVAITTLLDYTFGVIPLPMVSATIVHIPTVITGIVAGPFAGAIVGFFMGLESLIHSATRPAGILAPLFVNPLISVLPRIFIGVASYYAYNGFKRVLGTNKDNVAVFLGAAIGSLTNTIGVLGMIYIVYAQKVEQILQNTTAGAFVFTVATTNGVAELLVSGVIAVPIVMAIKKIKKR